MMLLFLKTLTKEIQIQDFFCQLPTLETALGTLTGIAMNGDQLLEAYIVEEGKRTNLPTTAFDGNDVVAPIQGLQREWESILNQPRAGGIAVDQSRLELMLQCIDQYEARMADYDACIARLEALILSTRQQLSEGARRDNLINRYESIIRQQRIYIAQNQAGRDRALQRLGQIKQAHLSRD